MIPGAVFDCVVFLQAAARETSPAGACFRLLIEATITLYVSPEILTEISEVLRRPKLRQRFKTVTPERVDAFLRELQNRAVLLNAVPEVFTYPRDPDDEPYVNLAVAARARYLVTWDKDLLDLANDATAEGSAFQQRFPDLRIVDPVAFLRVFAPTQTSKPYTEETPS
jgi:uncharacterized protein